jgi:hypothetical protein
MFVLIFGLVICSMLGRSQQPTVESAESLARPKLEKGSVQGKTYKNASIGLELTPDTKLKFGTPELKTKPLSLSLAAWGKFRAGSAREGMAFWVIESGYYPSDQRSTGAFMRRVVDANQKDGFKAVQSDPESVWGGNSFFARTDFSHKDPTAYEVVFVKACDTLAMGFVFTGSDRDAVNRLIAATELKLDSVTSGCASQSK